MTYKKIMLTVGINQNIQMNVIKAASTEGAELSQKLEII